MVVLLFPLKRLGTPSNLDGLFAKILVIDVLFYVGWLLILFPDVAAIGKRDEEAVFVSDVT